MLNKTLIAMFSLFAFNQVYAEMVPQPIPYETRLQKFVFDKDRSYEILTRPMSTTNIQLDADEKMVAFPMGDTSMWEIGSVGNNVFIKPKFERLVNPATLVTTKRSYQLMLKSGTADGIWYQRVHWEENHPLGSLNLNMAIPTTNADAIDKKKPISVQVSNSTSSADFYDVAPESLKDLDFEFSVEGDAPFKPTQVFSDGRHTWLQMPKDLNTMPAAFIKKGNELAIVNFIVKGRYIVIQSLFEEALLKFNDQEIMIVKNNNKKWWQ